MEKENKNIATAPTISNVERLAMTQKIANEYAEIRKKEQEKLKPKPQE